MGKAKMAGGLTVDEAAAADYLAKINAAHGPSRMMATPRPACGVAICGRGDPHEVDLLTPYVSRTRCKSGPVVSGPVDYHYWRGAVGDIRHDGKRPDEQASWGWGARWLLAEVAAGASDDAKDLAMLHAMMVHDHTADILDLTAMDLRVVAGADTVIRYAAACGAVALVTPGSAERLDPCDRGTPSVVVYPSSDPRIAGAIAAEQSARERGEPCHTAIVVADIDGDGTTHPSCAYGRAAGLIGNILSRRNTEGYRGRDLRTHRLSVIASYRRRMHSSAGMGEGGRYMPWIGPAGIPTSTDKGETKYA